MTTGTWFVLCAKKKAISIAALQKKLGKMRGAKIALDGEALTVSVGTRVLTVGLSSEPHVKIEAQEIAESEDRPELAKLDARYELLYDLRDADELYNTLAIVSGELEEAVGGVIYDVANAMFI